MFCFLMNLTHLMDMHVVGTFDLTFTLPVSAVVHVGAPSMVSASNTEIEAAQ